jgi:DNA-binding XRE family transcriptional regulator
VAQTTLSAIVDLTIIGNRIKERIATLGVTQDVAARMIGIKPRDLSRAINGKNAPRLARTLQIAAGLNTTIEALYIVRVRRARVTITPR